MKVRGQLDAPAALFPVPVENEAGRLRKEISLAHAEPPTSSDPSLVNIPIMISRVGVIHSPNTVWAIIQKWYGDVA